METVRRYLDAIEEINRAERAIDRSGSSPKGSARLYRAGKAAEAAWMALAPNLRDTMSPPPARGIQS
jgi:hypothetical protein